MAYQSKAHPIFDSPELLSLVCRSACVRDRVRLLRVSRLFLCVAAPLVWERVVGVEHVLSLLPDVTILAKPSERNLGKKTTAITVGSSISTRDRLDYYGPFVRHLEIYSSKSRDYHVPSWRRLLSYIENHNLLPNLVRLTLSATQSSNHDLFLWIRTFLSPSLNAIQVIPDVYEGPSEMSGLVAGSLLGQIIKRCPNIRNISLFPSLPLYSSEANGYVIADFCDSSFYDRLPTLHLTELGCTTEILTEEWIHVLEGLPLLERLDVYSADSEIATSNLSSPPALKHLGLHLVDWHEIKLIWKLNILAALSSLVISLPEDDEFDFDDVWGSDFISLICSRSPALASINLDFGPNEYALNNLSSLSPMSKLPLTAICFKSLESIADEVVENMAVVFPIATKLEFYDETTMVFTFDELVHLAKLPRLQHLVIGLQGDTREIKLGSVPAVSHSLHTLEICNGVEVGPDISLLAQYVPLALLFGMS
ncbi:hypothetical protein FRC07_006144 [Ceratobasidium sp. 392]|nr:hypothetical protein FRC07_006144 [Ceratobasidium sp. 392]